MDVKSLFVVPIDFSGLAEASLIIILAFSYQSILPSIVSYVGPENKKEIKTIILTGTILTCVIYLLWIIAVSGFINHTGESQAFIDKPTLSQLIAIIKDNTGDSIAVSALDIFLNVTLFASFLTVSIAFIDFWIDALKLNTKISGRLIAAAIALIPSLTVAIFFDDIFVMALAVSGFAGIGYSIALPSSVSYKLFDRYNKHGSYFFHGSKRTRGFIFIISIVFMVFALIY